MSRITIVHMGDSITFGQYVDPALRWTALTARMLEAEFGPRGHRFEIHNKGISGETTRQGLERFPDSVQNVGAQIMTLQFGLNDCNCWATDRGLPRVSEPAYEANLLEMIRRARHFGVRHVVVATNHRTLRNAPMASGEVYEAANARYSEILRQVAARTGAALCDVRAAFEPFSQERLADLLLPAPDVLHLSAEGNRVYAEVMWPYLRQAVQSLVQAREGAPTSR